MGEAARERALSQFSFDRYVDAYEELYHCAARDRPGSSGGWA